MRPPTQLMLASGAPFAHRRPPGSLETLSSSDLSENESSHETLRYQSSQCTIAYWVGIEIVKFDEC